METNPKNEAEAKEGRAAASDWLSGRAAFALRTCALAPRRGRGETEARWLPGRASQDPAGTRGSWLGHVLCFPRKGSGGSRGPSAARD